MTVAELVPGSLIADYRIEEMVGRGGMGVVYSATELALARTVALKVIAPEFARDHHFRERFQREARTAASLDHPNVLPIYKAGEAEGLLFLSMRYVSGPDLGALLVSGSLDPKRAAAIVAQVAQALDAAHARGLVHRDVKPSNVLLESGLEEARAYLSDFGLAKVAASESGLTRTGQLVGTLDYVAPEQIRGEPVDARSDVYSLSCVLFEALTGYAPYPQADELAKLWAHMHEPPPSVLEAAPELPRGFDEVVRRGMAKEPAERYPSAGDLARAAVAASRGKHLPVAERSVATGVATARVGTRPGARAAPRSRRRLAALMVGGLLAFAGVVAALAAALAGGGGQSLTPENAASPLVGEPTRIELIPDRIAVLSNRVWVLRNGGGRLGRINPADGRTDYFPAPIDLGGGVFPDIAGGFGSLWMTHSNATVGGVDRIDPATVEGIERVPLPSANAVAVAEDAVWATTTPPSGASRRRGTLARIDPTRNRLVAKPVPIGRDPADVAVGAGAVWVADRAEDVVVRVDPRTLRITARIAVGSAPGILAVAPRAVWIANLGDRTLTRIDPARNQVVGAPLALGKEIEDIELGDGALWVAGADGTVTRLDPASGETVGAPIPVGRAPLSLAWDGKRLWVASASDQTVQAIEPGR